MVWLSVTYCGTQSQYSSVIQGVIGTLSAARAGQMAPFWLKDFEHKGGHWCHSLFNKGKDIGGNPSHQSRTGRRDHDI